MNFKSTFFKIIEKNALAALILAIAVGCAPKISKLAPGNLNNPESQHERARNAAPNSENDEVAPSARPSEDYSCAAQHRDFSANNTMSDSIMPASYYIKKMFPVDNYNKDAVDYLTKKVENIYFTGVNSGFAAFAHQPDEFYAVRKRLPIYDTTNVGGTDIFEFSEGKDGKILFKNLGKPVNSEFWDSHPTSVRDTLPGGKCKTLLVWASDRNHPYSYVLDLKGNVISRGNSDLFYAFRDENGNFSEVKEFSPSVNTNSNEGTPFIYCDCCQPVLFYSEDINGNKSFNIYAVRINIDYVNETISESGVPKLVDDPKDDKTSKIVSINSTADDRFPFVALPYKENGSDNYLYFASNRYSKDRRTKQDTSIINEGGYDLYRFPLPDEYRCTPPEPPVVNLRVVVLDVTNPDIAVKSPKIKLEDKVGNAIDEKSGGNSAIFKLEYNKEYKVFGGSDFNDANCGTPNDSKFLIGYAAPKEIIINGRADSSITTVEDVKTASYDDFIKIPDNVYDTVKTKVNTRYGVAEATSFVRKKKSEGKLVDKKISYSIFTQTRTYWHEPKRVASKEMGEDSLSLIGATVPGEYTRNRVINTAMFYKDTTITDTVYVLPRYFIKPPCHCEFTEYMTDYQRNVPYFQTGFWEVNSRENFPKQLEMLKRNRYADAKWIELSPENRYWYKDSSARDRRIAQYRQFADTVSMNLNIMANVIDNYLIPAYEIIDSITKNAKLVITIRAFSDYRPVDYGWYIGDDVNYVQGEMLPDGNLEYSTVKIANGKNLNTNNDTLSKLRAYNGYQELEKRLKNSSKFGNNYKKFLDKGEVVLPENLQLANPSEREKILDKAKIIILTKGYYADKSVNSGDIQFPFYSREKKMSYYALDTIRRIDVEVKVLQYDNGKLIKSPCCNDQIPCIESRKKIVVEVPESTKEDTEGKEEEN